VVLHILAMSQNAVLNKNGAASKVIPCWEFFRLLLPTLGRDQQ